LFVLVENRTAEQEFSAGNSCEPVPRPHASDDEHESRGRFPLELILTKIQIYIILLSAHKIRSKEIQWQKME
jgi:hypothetical protein